MENKIKTTGVQTRYALNNLWRLWKIAGVYPNIKYTFLQRLHLLIAMFLFSFVLITVLVIQLFFLDNSKQLLTNLPVPVALISCDLKLLSVLIMRQYLIGISDHFDALDRTIKDPVHVKKLKKTVSFCNRFTALLWLAYLFLVTSSYISPILSHRQQLPFDIWTPYDYHNPAWVYWSTLMFQFFSLVLGTIQNATNDGIGPVLFIMLNAHINIVMKRIEGIGWNFQKTNEENYKELIDCINTHRTIIKIFNILQDTVSYTILIQFGCTALTLSIEALLAIAYNPTPMEVVVLFACFVDGSMQILPSCYYSNEFMVRTDRVVTSIYMANFPDQSPKFKKLAIIFMQMTQKNRVLMAGKLVPVTLQTFASIIKLAYSILTLSQQLQ